MQQQLFQARSRLIELESERRQLLESSFNAIVSCTTPPRQLSGGLIAGSSPPGTSPPSSRFESSVDGAAAAAALVAAVRQASFGSKASGAVSDRKKEGEEEDDDAVARLPWLLADGRLLTACLEGENRALKRAVDKARVEIDELERRRAAAEQRAKILAAENRAAAQALQRVSGSATPMSTASLVPTEPSAAEAAAGNPLAAASLRHLMIPASPTSTQQSLVNAAESHPFLGADVAAGTEHLHCPSCKAEAAPSAARRSLSEEAAKSRLLAASLDIERHFEEILHRRSKALQVVSALADPAAPRTAA